MKKKIITILLRVVISFGLIGYFIYTLADSQGGLSGAFRQFGDAFANASMVYLIPAGLLHVVGFGLMSLRWKILLRAQGVETSYGRLFLYYFMAAFFNTFLPSTIGGDTVRAIESKRHTGNTTTSVMVVIVERLTGLMALVIIAAVGLVITAFRSAGNELQAWLILLLALGVFGLAIFLAHPKIAPRILRFTGKFMPVKVQSFLEKAYEAVENYYKRPGILLTAQLVSIVFQVVVVFYYFLIALALNQDPDPVMFMTRIPVVIFLLMTVPAINGLGVRTAGFKGLMKFPAAYALAAESLDLVFRIGYGLLGGIVYLFYRRS